MSGTLLELESIAKITLPADLNPGEFEHARQVVSEYNYLPKKMELVAQLLYLATIDEESTKVPVTQKQLHRLKRSCGCMKQSPGCIAIARQIYWAFPVSMLALALSAYGLYRAVDYQQISAKLSLTGIVLSVVSIVGQCIVGLSSAHPKSKAYTEEKGAIKKSYKNLTLHLIRLTDENPKLASYLAQQIKLEVLQKRFFACGLGVKCTQGIIKNLNDTFEYIRKGTINETMNQELQEFIVERNSVLPV